MGLQTRAPREETPLWRDVEGGGRRPRRTPDFEVDTAIDRRRCRDRTAGMHLLRRLRNRPAGPSTRAAENRRGGPGADGPTAASFPSPWWPDAVVVKRREASFPPRTRRPARSVDAQMAHPRVNRPASRASNTPRSSSTSHTSGTEQAVTPERLPAAKRRSSFMVEDGDGVWKIQSERFDDALNKLPMRVTV